MNRPVWRVRWRLPVAPALFVFSLLPLPSYATLYKCAHQGSLTYSDRPCEGQQRELTTRSATTSSSTASPDYPAQLARDKAELSQLQDLRERRERQDQQIRDLAVRGQVAKQKKCRTLALQSKWKQEDAEQAPLKSKATATRKARRSLEKFHNECS